MNGGAYPKSDIRPLWKRTCIHSGVRFPAPYRSIGIFPNKESALVNDVLPPEAEEFVVMYANLVRKGNPVLNSSVFQDNFHADIDLFFPSNKSIKKRYFDWDYILQQLETETSVKKRDDTVKKESSPSVVNIDGELIPVTRNVVDRPGIFTGRSPRHPLNGKIRRRIEPEDVVINISRSAPRPSLPPSDYFWNGDNKKRKWKDVIHDPWVSWLSRWEDPLSKIQKYVYPDPVSSFRQHHEMRKFDMARTYFAHRHSIREIFITDLRNKRIKNKSSMAVSSREQVAAVVLLIDEFGIRSGNDDVDNRRDEQTGVVGATTLKKGNLVLLNSTRIRLCFLGKDRVPFDRTKRVPEELYETLNILKRRGGEREPGLPLFPDAHREDVNSYLDRLIPGLTCKVIRTAIGSALVDERLRVRPITITSSMRGSSRSGSGGGAAAAPPGKTKTRAAKQRRNTRPLPDPLMILNGAMWEVAWLMNHKKAVGVLSSSLSSSKGGRTRESYFPCEGMSSFEDIMTRFWKACYSAEEAVSSKKDDTTDSPLKEEPNFEVAYNVVRGAARCMALSPQTAKVNYVDPRIIVAFCRNKGLDIQKAFSSIQIERFGWALDTDANFAFRLSNTKEK